MHLILTTKHHDLSTWRSPIDHFFLILHCKYAQPYKSYLMLLEINDSIKSIFSIHNRYLPKLAIALEEFQSQVFREGIAPKLANWAPSLLINHIIIRVLLSNFFVNALSANSVRPEFSFDSLELLKEKRIR